MSEHVALVAWERGDQAFLDLEYSRRHTIRFDGGVEVAASAAPTSVPPPLSDPTAVDPEEAFVAALASCHMLWFLAHAAKAGYRIDHYRDEATGTLAKDADGRLAVTHVVLRPHVVASGPQPLARATFDALHHAAHASCFIAASIRSHVVVEAVLETR